MPARKKTDNEEAAEPARRSTRIKDLPPKSEPAAAAATKGKKKKDAKTDPDAAEYRPTKRTTTKKRKKSEADEDAKEADAEDDGAEEQPKKKVKGAAAKKSNAAAADATAEDGDSGADASDEKKHLTVGDALPSLVLKNEKGEDVQVAELAKESGVIIFAIPKADTPGCNKQACHFRDNYDDIKKLGYVVYALSADTSTAQTKWQGKFTLPYSLLSDPKRTLIEQLGAKKTANSTTRSHFVFEKGTGKLLHAQLNVNADKSHELALEFIKGL